VNQNSVAKWIAVGSLAVTGAWVRIPYIVQILLMIMALDIISGICAAIASKQVNSSVMVRGLFKKLAVFPLLALLHIIEKPLNLPFEFESIAAIAFILYEAMSIVENCANAGVPIPAVIVTALAKAKIKTASPADIKREFEGDTSTVSIEEKTEIVKTPPSLPDLKVATKTTTIEEKHIEPIP